MARPAEVPEEQEVIEVMADLLGERTVTPPLLPPLTFQGVPESIQQRIRLLSKGEANRVLCPLCILTENRLPTTFSGVGCHDTFAEMVKWEIVPGERVTLTATQVELLARFRLEMFTLEAVTNFNIEAVSEELRFGSSKIQDSGTSLKNLAPPFFLFCPLTLDGQNLDFNFVINSLRLIIMSSTKFK